MTVASEGDLVASAHRAEPPEVLLGGSPTTFNLLSVMNQLAPIDSAGSSLWCGSRRPETREPSAIPQPAARASAVEGRALDEHGSKNVRSGAAQTAEFRDPRTDPASLASALNQLDTGRFSDGYAQLVNSAATHGRIGRRPGTDLPGDRGGESAVTVGDLARAAGPVPTEGVAILRGARSQDLAQGFLRFLVETQRTLPGRIAAGTPSVGDSDYTSLVADLLGATLVDGQDELWAAWRSLASLDDSRQARSWLTEPPPWPPVSVARYLGREGDKAMTLIETLAAELAPDPAVRSWLIRSWLSPRRPLDAKLLAELAQAAGGRLCREPRFRAWLREEWTASARQRYRRIARWAAARKSAALP